MMSRMLRFEGTRARDSLVAVAAPLLVIAVSYSLWFVSDRLLYVGPFDRATFGWAVVMPIWLVSPAVAALLWRRLPGPAARASAIVTAVVIGAVAALLLWVAFDPAACETSPRTSAAGLIGPTIFVGLLIGGGWALCGLIGRDVAVAGRPKLAVAAAVALAIGHLFLVLGAFYFVIVWFGGCNRPGTV
jgi:hypothetical protein